MTTLLEIGTTLKEERKRCKLSQKQVAEAAGVHRNTLAALEAGKGNVELNTLITVCKQLGLVIRVVPKEVAAMVGTGAEIQQSALSARINEKLGVAPAKK
jgi:transcriptional regulator with XRE-family HTH domain